MKTWLKRLILLAVGALALLALVVATGWWRTRQTLALRWQLPPAGITYAATPALLARGEHLARTRGCTGCHGDTLAGQHLVDAGPVIQIHTPNLTRGGVLPQLDIVAFEHAVRHGVGREGRPLLIMPAGDYMLLSNEDLAALHAYLQSVPAQPDAQPQTTVGPLGWVLHLFGALPLVSAPEIDHPRASRGDAAPSPDQVEAWGGYIAQACTGCHGRGLAGGPMPGQPPGMPPPANLTPHREGLLQWSEADFLTAMRSGKRPDGRQLEDFMPWRNLGQMDDAELHAVWVYLRSLPPTATPR